jgi:hypothetical protein
VAANPVTPKRAKQPVSARDQFRARTNYTETKMENGGQVPRRYTGYAPIPFAAIAEIPRLSSGAACQQLLYVILALSVGRTVKDSAAPYHECTEPVKIADLVNLCCCEERQLQRELLGLAQRGVIRCERSGKGEYILTPLFRTWGALQDYKPGPTPEPAPDDDEPEQEDEAAKSPTVVKLTDKPVPVRAGGASRKIKVETGVSEIWCKSNVDIHFEAVIQSGCLLVNFIGPQFKAQTGNGLLKSKGLPDFPRHPRRVEHPRAAEVCGLFDPFLVKNRRRTLSGDGVCLEAACEAIADVPNDFLVKYVIDRAARPISGPRAALAICRDAAHDYQISKNPPPEKKKPGTLTQEDIDALIAAERAAAAAKRRRA